MSELHTLGHAPGRAQFLHTCRSPSLKTPRLPSTLYFPIAGLCSSASTCRCASVMSTPWALKPSEVARAGLSEQPTARCPLCCARALWRVRAPGEVVERVFSLQLTYPPRPWLLLHAQIFVKTLTGKTITLEVGESRVDMAASSGDPEGGNHPD